MRQLSKTDQAYFADFKQKYPGWEVNRYEDGTLEFVKPERNYEAIKPAKRNILRSI